MRPPELMPPEAAHRRQRCAPPRHAGPLSFLNTLVHFLCDSPGVWGLVLVPSVTSSVS